MTLYKPPSLYKKLHQFKTMIPRITSSSGVNNLVAVTHPNVSYTNCVSYFIFLTQSRADLSLVPLTSL